MKNMLDEMEIQAITDSAWREGFEAGLHLAKNDSEASTLLRDLIDRLNKLNDMADEYTESETDVEVDIGDIVEIEPNEFYVVCKVDRDDIVAVDPKRRRLVSGKLSDIISIGKIQLGYVVGPDESL